MEIPTFGEALKQTKKIKTLRKELKENGMLFKSHKIEQFEKFCKKEKNRTEQISKKYY